MTTRRASELTISYSPTWKRQSGFDVPLTNGDILKAFPATSRNYLDVDETTEDVMDCTGQDFLFEILTAQFARLTVDFDVDPDILAGVSAFGFGVAQSPTGGTNEVQNEVITATGGSRILIFQIGANAQYTAPIAFDADAAAIQAALEALSNIAPGDVVVAGTGTMIDPFTYTFGGALAKQDINLIVVQTYGLTGGTSVFTTATPGVGQTHAISRVSGVAVPLTTLYIGFRGSSQQPFIFKNVGVDSIRVRSATQEKVTATVQFVGSADLIQATAFTTPECTDIIPIRFGDCQMNLAGVDYIAANMGREFDFTFQNNLVPKFDGAGVNITRLERNDVRPVLYNHWTLGEPGDTQYVFGQQKLTLPASLRLGPSSRNVLYNIPQGYTKLNPTGRGVRFGGTPPESEVALIIRPKKASGQATTPVTCTAVTSQGTAYLVAA